MTVPDIPAPPSSDSFQVVFSSIPEQKTVDGIVFPLVLSPHVNASSSSSDFFSWIESSRDWINQALLKHGAIFFRGFPTPTPKEFNDAVESFGWPEFPYVGGAAPRSFVLGRVFTSNEAPPTELIPWHHEMAQVKSFPQKLLFFCDVAAEKGGATPLCLSHAVCQRIQERHPEFYAKLKELGVKYTRVLSKHDDPTSPIGRGWISTYASATQTREEAEKKMTDLAVNFEWVENENLRTVTDVLPAIRQHPVTGEETWFNSIVAVFTGWNDVRNVGSRAVTFGDGTPLPEEGVLAARSIMNDVAVAAKWHKGDFVVIDNNAVMHSRETFEGSRRILASLTK